MKKNYTIKLEGKEWETALDNAFKKKSKNIKVDGFRKGQVPKNVYIKQFGIESLYMEAIDMVLPTLYDKLLNDKETIKPAATPSIDIKNISEEFVEVEFTIVSAPEVKLGKYKGLGIKKESAKVTKEEIDHELEHIMEQFVELKVLDKEDKIKKGHTAIIDFEGFKDGTPFQGGKGEAYSLEIGSNSFIPGFEEKLIGLKAGDKKELNLTFPENYHSEDLKGKDVVFKVKVKEVKEKILPKMDKTFFEDLGIEGVDTEEKLRKEIEGNILVGKERKIDDDFLFECLDLVVKDSKVEVPEEMINDEVDRLIKEFSQKLEMQGMKLEQYLGFTGSKEEDLKEQMKDEAQKRVSYRLILDAVREKEKIEVSKEDIKNEIKEMSEKYGVTKDEFIKQVGGEDFIKYDMGIRKAIEVITG